MLSDLSDAFKSVETKKIIQIEEEVKKEGREDVRESNQQQV